MNKKKNSPLESISIGIALLLLLLVFIYFINYTLTHTKIVSDAEYASTAPMKGDYASIESVKTHWVVKDGVHYPQAIITLNSSESKSGLLRVYFQKNVGAVAEKSTFVGDANTYSFENGVFRNGKNIITIQCTKGLPDLASFIGYRAQDESRWVVKINEGQVNEGNSIGTRDNPFKLLGQAPIDAVILESSD